MPKCGGRKKDGKCCGRRVKNVGDVCSFHQTTCSICLNNIETNMTTLKCKHAFHDKCIEKWKEQGKNTCPCCRKPFRKPVYSALILLYPSSGSEGDAAILRPNNDMVDSLLEAVNISPDELEPEGDTINLQFESNTDLIEFFEEVGFN